MIQQQVKHYGDLRVWQEGMALVMKVYEVARKLPPEERYDLGSQIRRAAVSIPANVVEGQARQHTKEFHQCLYISRGSLAELDTLLILAQRLGYLNVEALQTLQEDMADVRRPLQGLIKRLHAKRHLGSLATGH
ncbi:MAG: four helix bundle protein [Rubrivivax sp.]|nr:four helix bundle protein [Rubrivivax sp.]